MIGTGGAGLAVAYAAFKMGAKELRLFDTHRQSAEDLSRTLCLSFPDRAIRVSESAAAALQGADGLIQATPVGMLGYPGMLIDAGLLRADQWVADIVYFPLETELLKEARRRGCRVVGGGGMVVRQAARSFRQFFQLEPNVPRMLQQFMQADEIAGVQ